VPSAAINPFTGTAPVVTAADYPTPHPYPSLHLNVQWPDDLSGLTGQVVLTVLDSTGAIVGRSNFIGALTRGGAVPLSMGVATYAAPPFTGTALVRLSSAPCGSQCEREDDFCAPGGLLGTPACQALPELPGPYLSEVTRSIAFD
jgi:hypothetical protein